MDAPRHDAGPSSMLVSAIACGAVGLRFGATRELIPALVLAFALVGISAIDLRYRIIPDRITLPLAVAGRRARRPRCASPICPSSVWRRSARALFLLLAALMAPSRHGDGRRQARRSCSASSSGARSSSPSSSASSSVIVPTLAVLPSKGLRARKMHLALGPFLALGGMVALLAGDDVIAWYTGD